MNIIIIKTKDDLVNFTNEMELFYSNVIDYINLIIDQTDKLINNCELKITDIENLLNIFILSIDILIQKKFDKNYIKKINIEQDNKTYLLFNIPKYRIKYYKKKLIGKIVFDDNNLLNFLVGYKLDCNILDINLLRHYLVVIKKRFIKLNDYFLNKKSELVLYFNNIIMLN